MAKVEPLYDLLNKKIPQFGLAHEDLSIDESTVLTTAVIHVSNSYVQSQFVSDMLWVLASATGVPYKIEIYQGMTNQGSDEALGTRAAKNALEICKNPKDHSVYFDNFFSSYSLICDLTTKGFRATGTMRNDRIMKCPLVDVKKMKKNKR